LLTSENLQEFVFLVKLALVSPEIIIPYADEIVQIGGLVGGFTNSDL